MNLRYPKPRPTPMQNLPLAKQSSGGRPSQRARAMLRSWQTAKTRTKPNPKSLFLRSKGIIGCDCIQPGPPMGKLGSQAVEYQVKALAASDPSKNAHLLNHYEG